MKWKSMVGFIERVPIKILGHLPYREKSLHHYLMQQIKEYEKYQEGYYSLYFRPRYQEQFTSIERSTESKCKAAIVLQGPLVEEDDFTVETVKIYEKLYPGVLVIVSTWENEDQEVIERLRRLKNCEVVLSQYPNHSGILNLNYQVVGTMAGIQKAKKLGREYVFKTRCDFRFSRLGLIDYFIALCNSFPVDESVTYQKQRLIVGGDSLGSFFRAFWVADRFGFGQIDDMLAYWNYQLDEVEWPRAVVLPYMKKTLPTWKQRTENRLGAEPNIPRNYIERMEGKAPECTVKKYWEILKKQFITVSINECGGYWRKYDPYDEAGSMGLYYRNDSEEKCLCYNWDFVHWLSLYTGAIKYEEEYERFMENIYW